MSTTPNPVPASGGPTPLDRILSIMDLALKSAAAITGGPIGAGFNLADALLLIGKHAESVYESETGTPYDLSKVPFEDRV